MDKSSAESYRPSGINVICHATGSFGLAVAARNTIRTLDDAGVPIAVLDVDTHDGRSGRDTTYVDRLSHDAPFRVNLFHLNPPEVMRLIQESPPWLDLAGRLNACVPFWELPRVPEHWAPLLEALDVVLAPTRFVMDAVRTGAPRSECVHYPQTVYVNDVPHPDKPRWNLSPSATTFLLTFDLTSDIERKNPYAALDAFERSQLDADSAQLVVKLSSADHSRAIRREADRLSDRVRDDNRISIIETSLAYEEMLSLIASCDVLLALHRSEGLGLHLLEAMSLGKALITTGWSGNMDFTTEQNSCLVPFELVPVESQHGAYRPGVIGTGQEWADPDIEAASICIRRLAENPEVRRLLGEQGRADVEKLRNDPDRVRPLTSLVDAADRVVRTTEHAERARRLAAFTRIPLETRARRAASATLRSLGLRR